MHDVSGGGGSGIARAVAANEFYHKDLLVAQQCFLVQETIVQIEHSSVNCKARSALQFL
jgi:hypothetical protein